MQLYGLLRGDMDIDSRPFDQWLGVLVLPLLGFDCFHVSLISVEKSSLCSSSLRDTVRQGTYEPTYMFFRGKIGKSNLTKKNMRRGMIEGSGLPDFFQHQKPW